MCLVRTKAICNKLLISTLSNNESYCTDQPGAGASWVGPALFSSLMGAQKCPSCLVGGDNQAGWVFVLSHNI